MASVGSAVGGCDCAAGVCSRRRTGRGLLRWAPFSYKRAPASSPSTSSRELRLLLSARRQGASGADETLPRFRLITLPARVSCRAPGSAFHSGLNTRVSPSVPTGRRSRVGGRAAPPSARGPKPDAGAVLPMRLSLRPLSGHLCPPRLPPASSSPLGPRRGRRHPGSGAVTAS